MQIKPGDKDDCVSMYCVVQCLKQTEVHAYGGHSQGLVDVDDGSVECYVQLLDEVFWLNNLHRKRHVKNSKKSQQFLHKLSLS